MEDLLVIVDEEITLNPHFLAIQVIYDIWKRDHGQSQRDEYLKKSIRIKHIARKELSYIWFMEHWKSPYQSYTDPKKRSEKVISILELPESWKEDNKLKEAREWYAKELVDTNSELIGLKSSRKALGAIEEFLDTINLTDSTNRMPNGAAIFKPKDVASAIKELVIAKKAVKEQEEAVRKAQTTTKRIRGGGEAGMYEN